MTTAMTMCLRFHIKIVGVMQGAQRGMMVNIGDWYGQSIGIALCPLNPLLQAEQRRCERQSTPPRLDDH